MIFMYSYDAILLIHFGFSQLLDAKMGWTA